ncbi:hypothetical protein AA14337_3291 [Acetobacter malorum DSM 14337]|uniref:Uncharacterized protein n=1 Tax=Acetobacter malorum DSM 14337 TaxID=1307910 RepID=A0ABQ0Q0S2_9PROT|nr:hypothetical protein AA14337_3291 [Acetobacter malorum DSM 14337]
MQRAPPLTLGRYANSFQGDPIKDAPKDSYLYQTLQEFHEIIDAECPFNALHGRQAFEVRRQGFWSEKEASLQKPED